jgi:hypothetical protein
LIDDKVQIAGASFAAWELIDAIPLSRALTSNRSL